MLDIIGFLQILYFITVLNCFANSKFTLPINIKSNICCFMLINISDNNKVFYISDFISLHK